jgi:hypothetical protein
VPKVAKRILGVRQRRNIRRRRPIRHHVYRHLRRMTRAASNCESKGSILNAGYPLSVLTRMWQGRPQSVR